MQCCAIRRVSLGRGPLELSNDGACSLAPSETNWTFRFDERAAFGEGAVQEIYGLGLIKFTGTATRRQGFKKKSFHSGIIAEPSCCARKPLRNLAQWTLTKTGTPNLRMGPGTNRPNYPTVTSVILRLSSRFSGHQGYPNRGPLLTLLIFSIICSISYVSCYLFLFLNRPSGVRHE